MDESITENDPAGMQKKLTIFSGMTTTLPSGVKPFCASTVSDNGKKEFTDSVSILPNGLEMTISKDTERYFTTWLERWEYLISEYSALTTTLQYRTKNSSNGSTGLFPEEAES